MKHMPLTQNKFAIVDDEDYEELNRLKWFAAKSRSNWYVHGRACGSRRIVKMHRLIVNAPSNLQIDHINGNGLDNRRCNLRLCTNSQNQQNMIRTYGKSKYKGVSLHTQRYWRPQIRVNYKSIYLGLFRTEIQAAIAYDEAAVKYFGEFARTNKMLGLLK